jgi:hypothetical protein
MNQLVSEPIIKVNGVINHDLVDDLLSGKKVVDSLNYEDSIVLEQAMFEKLKTKYQSIYQGFSLEGELVGKSYTNHSGELGKHSPTNKISTDSFKFNIKVDFYDHLQMRGSFENESCEYVATPNGKKLRELQYVPIENVTEFRLMIRNGVDKGNAYGTKTDTISRTYKIKSIKLIMQRLEEYIDKFNIIADEKRPIYQEGVKNRKQERLDSIRFDAQESFRKLHNDYSSLKTLAVDYHIEFEQSSDLAVAITKRGHDELERLKEIGSTVWIDSDAKRYVNFGLFL